MYILCIYLLWQYHFALNSYNYLPSKPTLSSNRSLISSLPVHVCGHIYLPFTGCSVKPLQHCLNHVDKRTLHVLKSVNREASEAAAIEL